MLPNRPFSRKSERPGWVARLRSHCAVRSPRRTSHPVTINDRPAVPLHHVAATLACSTYSLRHSSDHGCNMCMTSNKPSFTSLEAIQFLHSRSLHKRLCQGCLVQLNITLPHIEAQWVGVEGFLCIIVHVSLSMKFILLLRVVCALCTVLQDPLVIVTA